MKCRGLPEAGEALVRARGAVCGAAGLGLLFFIAQPQRDRKAAENMWG